MSDEKKRTAEEIQEERAKRKELHAQAEQEQFATDLEALNDLEIEHGDGTIGAVSVRFVQGFPTRAFFKTPSSIQYKRYVDQVHKAVDKKNTSAQRAAQETLAKSCWVYPKDADAQAAMLESFPGLLTSIALAAASLAEGRAEEEGKG